MKPLYGIYCILGAAALALGVSFLLPAAQPPPGVDSLPSPQITQISQMPSSSSAPSAQSADKRAAARVAYFFWDWSVDEAQIDLLVPPLVGHFDAVCIVFIADAGDAGRIQRHVEHVLALPHPPLITGLTAWRSVDDVASWRAVGQIAAWCVARTGVPRVAIDIEFGLDGYLYHDAPLDVGRLAAGLRAFSAALPGVQVYFYPPNYESEASPHGLRTVARRTVIIATAQKALRNFHAIGATYCTKATAETHALRAQYRSLEALWSAAPGPAEQIYLMRDSQWTPANLRAALPTIPYDCWLYVEPPYTSATAQRLLDCLPPITAAGVKKLEF